MCVHIHTYACIYFECILNVCVYNVCVYNVCVCIYIYTHISVYPEVIKAVFREKFIVVNIYIRNERAQINNLNSQLFWVRRAQ